MKDVGIGLIGTGFMGKCHAMAFGAVKAVFGDVPTPRLEFLFDPDQDVARRRAEEFGFSRWTTDWREMIADPAVEVVSITAPNSLHREMTEAAAQAGKAVYCEKPLALTLADGIAMADAVRQAGVASLTGYNYLRNPALIHAKKLIEDGAIGHLIQFRGIYDEDYMADPAQPFTWRCRIEDAGSGALGDLTVHLISVARYLIDDISQVMGDIRTVHAERPDQENPGHTGKVENEDQANALLRFRNGVQGVIASSRVAWGRKIHLAWEVHGSAGMITFDQERMNELRIYRNRGDKAEQGFKTILTSAAHPPYGQFNPAPGHGLGFNDLKVIEVAHLLRGLDGQETLYPNMDDALHIERVIYAIISSSDQGAWVTVNEP
jgi:predicted dehydrogenase